MARSEEKDPLIGKVLAHQFEILNRIGEGSTGVVYKAKQLTLDRTVAVKLLGSHLASNPLEVKRFHNEARAVARLTHPNTVRLIDFGETKEGFLYLVMEYLAGYSLGQEIHRIGRLPPYRALHILSQICLSLQEAHEQGIIHRDIRPDNIILVEINGKSDIVKVIDFSVSKLNWPDTPQTKPGAVFGNPIYMSPEYARGTLTPLADIYSCGITAYEMLTGKPPFEAREPMETIMMHIRLEPAPLQGFPEQLERLVLKALKKDVEQRYQTAHELFEACRKSLASLYPSFKSEVLMQSDTREDPPLTVSASAPMLLAKNSELLPVRSNYNKKRPPGIGDEIANYRLIRILGQGGMGTVFLCEHIHIGTKLACKILLSEYSHNPQIVERFINEARVMAALKHPNIAAIFDCDMLPSGHVYILMEYLEGLNLSQFTLRRKPSESTIISITRQIASALAVAHKRGIIHRDLKPDNIILVEDAATNGMVVKVLDFGIAKLYGRLGENREETRTEPGALLGTPAYMSPEQIRNSDRVDQRSDLYALGCVIYFMATGQSPYAGHGPLEVLGMHLNDPIPSLSNLNHKASRNLDRIVQKLLAKDPSDRFQRMEDLLREIELLNTSSGNTSRHLEADIDGPEFSEPKAITALGPSQAYVTVNAAPRLNLWNSLKELLPESLRPARPSIEKFFSSTFENFESISKNLLRLYGAKLPGTAEYGYFCVFMEGAPAEDEGFNRLGTRTFRQYTAPLELYLQKLQSDTQKVIIVIADSIELGRGVREKILEYRKKFDAVVIPLHVGEIQKADRLGRLDVLFRDRITDLHTAPDYFANNLQNGDPMNVFGMKVFINDTISYLRDKTSIIALYGPPGSGKTSVAGAIEYSIDAKKFVTVLCNIIPLRTPVALAEEVAAALTGLRPERLNPSQKVKVREIIQEAIQTTSEERGKNKEKTVLTLENADWAVDMLSSSSTSNEDLLEIRAFWLTLVEASNRGSLSTIITCIRGFTLGYRMLLNWSNPLSSVIHCRLIPALDYESVDRMVRELGIQMNVHFDNDAIKFLYNSTGGHVAVIRKICSYAINRHSKRADHNFLANIKIIKTDLEASFHDLASIYSAFSEFILPWLTNNERIILYSIATKSHRSQEGLKRSLEGIVSSEEVISALNILHLMGIAKRVKGRERVAIPLLEEWIKRNLDRPVLEQRQASARRRTALSLGLAGTVVMFILYWQIFQLQMQYIILSDYNDCSYAVKFPKSAIDNADVFIFRSCKTNSKRNEFINIIADAGTVAKFGEQLGESEQLMKCPPNCTQAKVEIKLMSPLDNKYEFSVNLAERSLGKFTVLHDRLASLRRSLDNAMKIASLIPAFLGLVAAYFQDWLGALKRLKASLTGRANDSKKSDPEKKDDKTTSSGD